jgi:hypothetical protein
MEIKTPPKRTSCLLNRRKVREYVMARCKEHDRQFCGVSKKFHVELEAKLKVIINDAVYRHPSRVKRMTDVPQGFI